MNEEKAIQRFLRYPTIFTFQDLVDEILCKDRMIVITIVKVKGDEGEGRGNNKKSGER